MFKSLRGRLITTLIVVAMAGWQLYTNYRDTGSPLKLGLDLQGGMHLVLEVDDSLGTMTPEARAAGIEQAERVLRTRIDEFGVEEPLIQRSGAERLIVELAGITDPVRARGIIQQSAYLEFKLVLTDVQFDQALARMDRAVVTALGPDSIRALGRAVEAPATGDIEDLLFGRDTAAGADTLAADSAALAAAAQEEAAPQEEQPTNLRPFTSILSVGDAPGTYLVASEDLPIAQLFLALPDVQRALPRGVALHWGDELVGRGARTYRRLYVLEAEAFMTGDMLEDATAGRDPQFNQAQVQFSLSRAGGRLFSRFTGQHVGDYLAIVLDGEVMSAPVIRDRIGAQGQIDLGRRAHRRGARPRAGAPCRRPADAAPDHGGAHVGPSLGADSIEQGQVAGWIGLALVLLIMVGYYRMAGVLAVGALDGVRDPRARRSGRARRHAHPAGHRGPDPLRGMAVDANVLIFERIREELAAGRRPGPRWTRGSGTPSRPSSTRTSRR
jgi:preprotein translocase subunit SecD